MPPLLSGIVLAGTGKVGLGSGGAGRDLGWHFGGREGYFAWGEDGMW